MFEVLGFLVMGALLVSGSIAGFLMMLDGLGQYNIGGSTNSSGKKIGVVVYIAVLIMLWIWYLSHFSVSLG